MPLSLERILTGHFDLLQQGGGDAGLLERITLSEKRPDYIPQGFLDYVASRYQRHGFEPSLNGYHNFEHTLGSERPHNTITVPAMYLTGSKDWTHRYAEPIGLDMHRQCGDLRLCEVTKAGRGIGQEVPERVNGKIAEFLAPIGH